MKWMDVVAGWFFASGREYRYAGNVRNHGRSGRVYLLGKFSSSGMMAAVVSVSVVGLRVAVKYPADHCAYEEFYFLFSISALSVVGLRQMQRAWGIGPPRASIRNAGLAGASNSGDRLKFRVFRLSHLPEG